jgi:type IV pilus assembly protein PilB
MVSLKERLTELLISSRLMNKEQLEKAFQLQKEKGGSLREAILALNLVKENDLVKVLSEGLGFPPLDLRRFKIDYEIVKIIPIDIARQHQVIAISKMGNAVTVAMVDPLNIFAIDAISSLTGYKINPIIASGHDIAQAIELSYPDATKGIIDNLVQEIAVSKMEFVEEKNEAMPSSEELSRVSREGPVIQVTNSILEEGVMKKSSDILIEPLENSLRLRFRIDGVLHEQKAPPKKMHAPIISRLKVISDLDISEHRLPQDGRFKHSFGGKEVDFRISILPSSMGEKAAIRILDKSQAPLDIDKLGFNEDAIAKLKKVSLLPHGMLLVCGPTGSGKTTTLYSLLKFVDSPAKNMVTVEDPVEYQLEGVNQVTARPDIGLSFAMALRSILRQDPNVIMIGEIRDYETVDVAIKSALTGHLVISTLHTTTAAGAVARLINMGVEPYMINAAVICVVSQRLVRRVCPFCAEKYEVKPEILESLKLQLEKLGGAQFMRGKGCPRCFNMGYLGRIGIAEVLLISPAIRELILSRAQEHIIKNQARKEGMRTLREDGLLSAGHGLTTLEEVIRVTAPDE